MIKIKKIFMTLAMTGLIVSGFTGCTFQDKTVYFETSCGPSTVFKIGDLACSKKEALLYLINEKNIYGTVDGVNLWGANFDKNTIASSLKDAVIEHLTKVYILDLYAKGQEMELTEEEKASCADAAGEYYASLSSDEKTYCGASKKDIAAMYERYALAEKAYTKLMSTVDEEVSEDEARVMEAFVLFVSEESKAQEIQGMIDYGYTFERLASTYTELDTYQVTFARGQYPKEVDDVVFNLDTDEVSGAIAADEGYYFFQCLNKYVEDLSEENKKVIIENRRKALMDNIVTGLQDQYFSDMNTELWDSIDITEEDTDSLTSDSFFSTLASHISF